MKFIKVLVLLCLSVASFSQSTVIPDFTLVKMSDGKIFTNKEMKAGQQSLFIFFDVSCGHCKEAISFFNRNTAKLANARVYLVTADSKILATNFLNANATKLARAPNTIVLEDRYNQFIQKFRPYKYPSMFLYSKTNQLLIYSDEPKDTPNFMNLIK